MRRLFPHVSMQHLSILQMDSSNIETEYTPKIDRELCEIESDSSQGSMKLTSVRTPQWRSRYDPFALNASAVAASSIKQPLTESIFLVLDEEKDDKIAAVQSCVFTDLLFDTGTESDDEVVQIRDVYTLDLRVSPVYQRMGIARQLMQHVLNCFLNDSDADMVSLGMVRDNYPSHRVFQEAARRCNIDYVCKNMDGYLISATDVDEEQVGKQENIVIEVLRDEAEIKRFFDQHLASRFLLYPSESNLDAFIADDGFKSVYIAYDKRNPDEFISFGVYDPCSRVHWVFVNPESNEREKFEFNYLFANINTFAQPLDSPRFTHLLQVLFNRIIDDGDGRPITLICMDSKSEHQFREVVSNNINSTHMWKGCEYLAGVSSNNQELFDRIKTTLNKTESFDIRR